MRHGLPGGERPDQQGEITSVQGGKEKAVAAGKKRQANFELLRMIAVSYTHLLQVIGGHFRNDKNGRVLPHRVGTYGKFFIHGNPFLRYNFSA